jgi:thiamine-phosphate pyrophosphorylase
MRPPSAGLSPGEVLELKDLRMQKSAGQPLLCYVTDRGSLPQPARNDPFSPLLSKIALAIAAGTDWIQIREKNLPASALAQLLRAALAATLLSETAAPSRANDLGAPRTRILVNDRLDVALTGKAEGVHLGENSLPISEAKRLLHHWQKQAPEFITGGSCHSLASAQAAESDGADYIFFGPVFATPLKIAFGEPQGLERLREVCHAVKIPILAVGGVTVQNAARCLDSGASGIAAIRLFQESSQLEELLRKLR